MVWSRAEASLPYLRRVRSLRDRKSEVEDGAMRAVGGFPQLAAMRLDDRAADREPDADPVLFRRIKAVEDARNLLRVEAASRILYRENNGRTALDLGPDGQLPRPIGDPDHSFQGVGDQIHDDLLQLDGIGHHQ